MIKKLYYYREFLKSSIKKEIRGKYKGAWLGIIWSFLNPLFMSLIFVVIFGKITNAQFEHNTVAVIIGVTSWAFFTTGVSQGTLSVVSNGAIIKKVYFPREIIPISYAASNLVVFLITSSITFIFIALMVRVYSWTMLLFPLIAILQFFVILSITMITSALFVYMRDLEHIIAVTLQALFYVTPAAFNLDPDSWGKTFGFILRLNPMYHLIGAYRDVLIYQSLPNLNSIIYLVGFSVILFSIGYPLFKKLELKFVEEF